MSLNYCVGHFVKVLENINKSFIYSKDLWLLGFTAPLFVSRGGRTTKLVPCQNLNQSKLDSNVNGVCNLCFGVDYVFMKYINVTVTSLSLFFLLPGLFLNCSRFNFQGNVLHAGQLWNEVE